MLPRACLAKASWAQKCPQMSRAAKTLLHNSSVTAREQKPHGLRSPEAWATKQLCPGEMGQALQQHLGKHLSRKEARFV